jgi:putative aminopeptidase FrvX
MPPVTKPPTRRARAARTTREPTPIEEIARELLPIPTASYAEHGVLAYIRRFAEERGLGFELDRFGNGYVRHVGRRRRGGGARPLVLGAHVDHPGFVVTEARGRRLQLEFRGGLPASYGRGERVRLFAAPADEGREALSDEGERGVAVIRSVRADERGRLLSARATLEAGAPPAQAGDLALWDVEPARIRGRRLVARGCDDLAGCVAVLSALDRAAATRASGELVGLFTRAEEVGLRGASAAARARLLPEDAVVLAIETSSSAGGRATAGGGPIVRVGDALHLFSPAVSLWMTGVAQQLVREDEGFRYQRKLMDGGVTEATAYDLYGYETGALCVALANYHNGGPRGRVAAESVHLDDLEGLALLLLRLLAELPRLSRARADLLARYDRLGREAGPLLRAARG